MKIQNIQDYLDQALNCNVVLSPVEHNDLPFFVRRAFAFYTGELFSHQINFFVAHSNDIAIKDIESAVYLFDKDASKKIIMVFPSMTRRERLTLIKRRISFIVPGTQMFLPYLGIDFFERIKEQRLSMSPKLRPTAQAILIQYLVNMSSPTEWQLSQISKFMHYTPMGTLRAVNQLEELNLCKIIYDGYRKIVIFDSDKKGIWKRALPYLRSPIVKMISVENDTILSTVTWYYAGEYALARYSNLSVSRKCYAIHETEYRDLLEQGHIHEADVPGGGVADIQVWRYTLPRDINKADETVDLLSLELSFSNTADPRIKTALLQIEENRTW